MSSDSSTLFLGVSCLIVACGCSAAPPVDGVVEEIGDNRESPIVNGKETSDYPATGVMLDYGQLGCTGTVIAPNKVLTAAHCIEQVDVYSLSFGFGPDVYQLDAEIAVVDAVPHPQFDSQALENDIAVLTLAEDAPVAPAAPNPMMDKSWIGKTITLVGYGVSDGASQSGGGIKREVDVVIDDIDATHLRYTTTNGQSACNGDSGGPAYALENGQLLVAGVTSYGDQTCEQFGVYTRVDAFLDFIDEQVKAQPDPNDPNLPPPDPNDPSFPPDPNDPGGQGCMGETYEGRCEGDTVIWCEYDQVMSIDCPYGCGFSQEYGYYDCL